MPYHMAIYLYNYIKLDLRLMYFSVTCIITKKILGLRPD